MGRVEKKKIKLFFKVNRFINELLRDFVGILRLMSTISVRELQSFHRMRTFYQFCLLFSEYIYSRRTNSMEDLKERTENNENMNYLIMKAKRMSTLIFYYNFTIFYNTMFPCKMFLIKLFVRNCFKRAFRSNSDAFQRINVI